MFTLLFYEIQHLRLLPWKQRIPEIWSFPRYIVCSLCVVWIRRYHSLILENSPNTYIVFDLETHELKWVYSLDYYLFPDFWRREEGEQWCHFSLWADSLSQKIYCSKFWRRNRRTFHFCFFFVICARMLTFSLLTLQLLRSKLAVHKGGHVTGCAILQLCTGTQLSSIEFQLARCSKWWFGSVFVWHFDSTLRILEYALECIGYLLFRKM